MENELYHHRLKGDRNGFTRIKGYTPIGERAQEVVTKVKTAVTKTATSIKDKVSNIISGVSTKKSEEGVQATQTALASIGEKKVQPKGKTFDTSTGIDEPAPTPEKKEEPKPSGATSSKTYEPDPSTRKAPTAEYDFSPDEVEAVVNEWNQRYEEIGLKPPAIPDEELRELLANKRRQMQHSMPRPADEMKGILMHHGIPKQEWGVRHGPPYPLDWDDKSAAQKKASPDKLRPSRSKDGMTTEEIEAANRRMRAENEYARLTSERTPAPAPSKWEVADGIASQAKAGSDYLLKWYDASRPKEKIRRGMADTRPDYEHMTTKEIADEVAWHKNYKELMKDDPYPKSKDTIREILQTLGTVTAFTSAATSLAKVYSDLKKK